MINALEDLALKLKAYQLLRKKTEPQVSQAFKGVNFYPLFKCLRILEGHTSGFNSLAITPDGQSIVSVSEDCIF